MGFIKTTTSIDLGDTPIENIFIDVYMPIANGTFVKVYLLGYKYACDGDINKSINNTNIAKNLNIPLSDVLAAWDFWESKKIIKKIPISSEDEWDYSVEFLNLKQLYIDNNYKSLQALSQEDVEPTSYSCSTRELIEANKVPEIKQMFIEINKIINRSLVPNEKMQILEWFHQYNIDPPLVIKAYSYCRHKKNVRNVKYVAGVIRNWYDQNITTVEQLQEHLSKQGERYSLYDRVFKAMGFMYREPSEAEMKIMDKWVDNHLFSIDIILKACENCSKTSNPNINYIDSILSDWHKKGIKKVDDLDIEKEKQKEQKKEPLPISSPKPQHKIKTKFHLSESRGSRYDAKELEELLLNRSKNKQ
ncbi:DnaD domain protein [Clostridium formicaceticum]|uniref:Primosomal replication protein N n=1 Tax=Clostridium formicaceticum TaxID=1497 RepID=A0AAC9WIF7_9CLOT|nr:DnaD domain protein [Clostridium formicaceticum]AOY75340.1 primosomal replication protein N [Clostridium formicaceticum]ARE89789.1 Replication initiation and membrane attachment [Clostridium formicaceticum]